MLRIAGLAVAYGVSRTTIAEIAAAGGRVLLTGLAPGRHGPQPAAKTLRVEQDRLVRSTVVLTEAGVSQRDIAGCLAEILDSRLSPSWVNAQVARVEVHAAAVNERWQPAVVQILSGDEIYPNGKPNLVVVGNDSLYIYALTRQSACDGETWGCVLLDAPDCPQFASDAGTQAWRRVRNWLRFPCISWTGIICCGLRGVRCGVWSSKPMPPWPRVRTGRTSLSRAARPSAWPTAWSPGSG